MKKHLAMLAVVGLCGATGAFAHDAYRLRVLDAQKQIEREHTVQVSPDGTMKVMPITVLESKGNLRRIGMTIADLRAMRAAPATSLLMNDAVYGKQETKERTETAPVVRISGIVDCGTGSAKWTALEYAKGMTENASFVNRTRNPEETSFLPKSIAESPLRDICRLAPVNG